MYDVVKTYVTEKIGDLTGLEVMAACPRSSRSAVLNALCCFTFERLIFMTVQMFIICQEEKWILTDLNL